MPSFRDVLSTLMDAYFIVDGQRRLKEQNRTFLELSGGRQKARQGAHCFELIKLGICNKECIALRAIKAGRTIEVSEIHGESLDGRKLVLVGRATPLKEEDGTLSGVLVNYRDVTEETSLRERFHQLAKEVKHEKDVLLKNLSEKTREVEELKRRLGIADD
jgi:sigma-54 dependent transcriptional regulator, acetoin dehydrogenase operon transcriptional activator AcoR